MRFLLVGLGNRGRMWAEILAAHPQATLSAAVDPGPAARAAFQALQPAVAVFATLEQALAQGGHDAVLLATPPDGHLSQATAIFAAGLPLLAEKPLAIELAEAVRIVELAEAARLPLSVGLNFRYLPVTLAQRALIAGGTLGAPGFASFAYRRNRDGRRPGLNKYPLTMQQPMMLEQSIHHLDLIRFCYGREVELVACRTWNPPWSMYAHDSNVQCHLRMTGGLEVDYVGTWTGGWNEIAFEWRTDCAGGIVVQRELFGDLAMARSGDVALMPMPIAPARPFYDDSAALLDAFVTAVAARTPPPCGGRDHLQTLALCFAAIAASRSGASVDVAAFAAAHGVFAGSVQPG